MGTEFLVGSNDEPVLDIGDDLDAVITQIAGWSYLFRSAQVHFDWYDVVIASESLGAFADRCATLAEQYGDPSRSWSGEPTVHSRAWTVSGTDLRDTLEEIGRVAREAADAQISLTIRSDRGWVEQTTWQAATQTGPDSGAASS
jgi:hypothetical protein